MRRKVKHLTNLLLFSRGRQDPIIGPLKAEWEVINICNARCTTCLHWQRKKDPSVLSTDEGMDLIRQLARAGVLSLCFTGGEPFLRKDLMELIGFAKRRGLYTSVVTNGLLVTERRAKELVDAGLDAVFISLDAADPELNDELRGMRGYFDLALSAIDNLKSMRRNAGPKIFIKVTVTTRNIGQLVPLAQLSSEKCIDGLSFQLAQILEKTDFVFDEALLIKEGDYSRLVDQIDVILNKYRRLLYGSVEYYQALRNFLQNGNSFDHLRCVSGFSYVFIDAWGHFFTSPSKTCQLGSIRSDSFNEIWYGEAMQDLRRGQSLFNKRDYLFESVGKMSAYMSDLSPTRLFRSIGALFNG